jgi:hypothetical protein
MNDQRTNFGKRKVPMIEYRRSIQEFRDGKIEKSDSEGWAISHRFAILLSTIMIAVVLVLTPEGAAVAFELLKKGIEMGGWLLRGPLS